MRARNSAPTVPAYDTLLWPTLCALKSIGGSASNEELLAKVVEIAGISEDTASVVHSDNRQTKLAYNLAWAKTYLKRVDALESGGRGVWAITKLGEAMTAEAAAAVPAAVRRQDNQRRRAENDSANVDGPVANGLQPEESWKSRLLTIVKAVSPDAFERLSQRVLREAGFIKVEVTGRSGDGGIDGIGVLRVNLLSFQVLFQCKRYQGSVSASAIRDFRGAMVGRSDKGLFITTGTFSSDARREATRDGAPAIDLIEGDMLCDLLKSLKLGVSARMVEETVIDENWFAEV